MTSGSPAKLIFIFAIPLMLGNVFQQVYTITDSLIISRSLGVDALAALGSCDWFDYMLISVIQALCQGFAILIAQQYGAEDYDRMQKSVAHSALYSFLSGIAVTIAALLLISPMLKMLNTPDNIAWMAREYLVWKFSGLLLSVLLNMTASILRAFGDSRTPLFSMIVSAVLNIGMDLLFVSVLNLGIGSAAFATVAAQGIGGIINYLAIRKLPFLHIAKESFAKEKVLARKMFTLAVPMMLANVLIAIGGMLVQSQVNRFDLSFIAGYTAANKLYGALELAALAYGFAMVTYVGQNYGARKYERIRKGIFSSVGIAVVTSLFITLLIYLFGRNLIAMFVTADSAEAEGAVQYGTSFLKLLASWLPVLYILHVLRSCLQGFGDTVTPMISGVAEFCARIFMAFFMIAKLGSSALFYAEIAAWFASDAILIPSLLMRMKKEKVLLNK